MRKLMVGRATDAWRGLREIGMGAVRALDIVRAQRAFPHESGR